MSGQEVLLFSLNRLARNPVLSTTASIISDRDTSQLSRAFSWFIHHILENFGDLLTHQNFNILSHNYDDCARAIKDKMRRYGVNLQRVHEIVYLALSIVHFLKVNVPEGKILISVHSIASITI